MRISHMTYTRVAHRVTPPTMVPRPHSSGIDNFLLDHYTELRSKATNNDAPLAFFVDGEAQQLFEDLRMGSDDEFYAAGQALAGRLIGEMDGRMEPGLLICLRIEDDPTWSAAVLKLEVVTPNSAVLERLDSGEEILEAVTNVLDAPGELQKGALVGDDRVGSDVVVGDRLPKDALYFPRAFGIKTEAKASDGTIQLVAALSDRLPAVTSRVIEILPTVEDTGARDVLTTLSGQIPTLTGNIQEDIIVALEQRPRPVRRINPRAALKRVLRAGGITISGPAAAMQSTTWDRQPDGRWRITIYVPEEPTTEYQ